MRRRGDRLHLQRTEYCLTPDGIALLPVIVQLGVWALRLQDHDPVMVRRLLRLSRGGSALQQAFMAELHRVHSALPRFAGARRRAPPLDRPVLRSLDDRKPHQPAESGPLAKLSRSIA